MAGKVPGIPAQRLFALTVQRPLVLPHKSELTPVKFKKD
jgi:hypothetical protein